MMTIEQAARQIMHGSYSPHQRTKVSILSMLFTYYKGLYYRLKKKLIV